MAGLGPSMLGKDDGRATHQDGTDCTIEERIILVSMQNPNLFSPNNLGKLMDAIPIQARLSVEHPDGKSFVSQVLAKTSEFVQADEDEPVDIPQLPRQSRGE